MLKASYVENETTRLLPFEGLHVSVRIVDFIAEVQVVQFFVNDQPHALNVQYEFPLDSNASICGFEAELSDKRVLVGQVRPKPDAWQAFEEAKTKGETAALLDQDYSGEFFSQEIANVPPRSRLCIRVVYLTELDYESTSGTAMFHFPTSIVPRYHFVQNPVFVQDPLPVPWARKWTDHALGTRVFNFDTLTLPWIPWDGPDEFIVDKEHPGLFSLSMDIQTSQQAIVSVTSLTHALAVNPSSAQHVFVTFFNNAYEALKGELNVQIQLPHEPPPSCIVEFLNKSSSGCAMLTFCPPTDVDMDSLPSPVEIVFLVDCSGSMSSEGKMESTKRALSIFLSSLPMNCCFDMVKFGYEFVSLFNNHVQALSHDTLKQAQKFVHDLSANMGGTEILSPLISILSLARKFSQRKRIVFVLTDGEVSNTEEVIKACQDYNANARIFAVGVGNDVSRRLVSGMASMAQGTAEFIVGRMLEQHDGADLELKLVAQLRLALFPPSSKLAISWNGARGIRQAPFIVPPVFAGKQLVMYAFFDRAPTRVDVSFESGGRSHKISCPVVTSPQNLFRTVHLLAARRLVKDLTEGRSYLHYQRKKWAWFQLKASAAKVRVDIINTCCTFGIMSQETSFLALESTKLVPFARLIPEKEYPLWNLVTKKGEELKHRMYWAGYDASRCVGKGIQLALVPFEMALYLPFILYDWYEDVQWKRRLKARTPSELKRREEQSIVKLLFVGPPGAGKTTFCRQIRMAFGPKFSEEELMSFRDGIHNELVAETKTMLQNSFPNHPLLLEESASLKSPKDEELELVRQAYQVHHEEPYSPFLQYMVPQLSRVLSKDYVPTDQDILHVNLPSPMKPLVSDLEIDQVRFRLIDFEGGNKLLRTCRAYFDDVTAVVMVVSLADVNQWEESLKLMRDLTTGRMYRNTSFILVANKKDLLRERGLDLTDPRLQGFVSCEKVDSNQYVEDATYFLTQSLVAQNQDPCKEIYTYCTQAVDPKNVEVIFNAMLDIVLKKNLHGSFFDGGGGDVTPPAVSRKMQRRAKASKPYVETQLDSSSPSLMPATNQSTPLGSTKDLCRLLSKQRFDGSVEVDEECFLLLGTRLTEAESQCSLALPKWNNKAEAMCIWVALLFLVHLQTQFHSLQLVWELSAEKTTNFILSMLMQRGMSTQESRDELDRLKKQVGFFNLH